jgi:hypothetical protein
MGIVSAFRQLLCPKLGRARLARLCKEARRCSSVIGPWHRKEIPMQDKAKQIATTRSSECHERARYN